MPHLSLALAVSAPAGPDLTRYFLVCAAMVAAIGVLAFGFKKLVAGSLRAKASKRSLQMVDVLPLGGKQKLVVVRCYDRTFALGLGEREVNLIAELDPVHVEAPAKGAATNNEDEFARTLEHASAGGGSKPARMRLPDLFRNGGVFG
jgi:flagellar biogenesis protein FliO